MNSCPSTAKSLLSYAPRLKTLSRKADAQRQKKTQHKQLVCLGLDQKKTSPEPDRARPAEPAEPAEPTAALKTRKNASFLIDPSCSRAPIGACGSEPCPPL